MAELKAGSVALTVTSPPYWNAIDYDRHARRPQSHYRSRQYHQGFVDYPEYLQWIRRTLGREVLRVTRPGGFLGVVVGTVLEHRKLFPVPFDLTVQLVDAGWEFHQDIVWHKCTAGVKRAGVALQHPYPGYFYPNIMNEYVLLFRKPGPPLYRLHDKEDPRPGRFGLTELFVREVANNVWHVAPVPPGQVAHPCPFPEEIPFRLISLYSYPHDLVLDPFVGSGQVAKVAMATGRRFVGYDTERAYVRLTLSRIREPLHVRAHQLVAQFGKVPLNAPLRPRHPGSTRHGSGRRGKATRHPSAGGQKGRKR
jgi:site-specific DNA-methyltransferase (adenine-specific)